jgi:hypothetical protein
MALNLAKSQYAQIRDMLLSNCPPAKIADAIPCDTPLWSTPTFCPAKKMSLHIKLN